MVSTDPRIFYVNSQTNLTEDAKNCVAVIGNMDGVHLGHQALIDEARDFADSIGALTAAIVFDPHPRRYFQPDAPPFLLTPTAHKADLLLRCGVDRVFVLAFNETFAALSPDAFIDGVLRRQLGLAGIVVGRDFQFGKGRAGTAESLRDIAAKFRIETMLVTPIGGINEAEKYSSSTARNAIRQGNMQQAMAILGRHWSIRGEIVMGQRLGRTLNFPTANILLGDYLPPAHGVYATVAIWQGKRLPGVANFGTRPTVDGHDSRLEVHLFNFAEEIYGETLDVELHHFIRAEQKFAGLEALKAQITKDCETARSLLSRDLVAEM